MEEPTLSPNWDKPTRKPVVWINGWPAVGKAAVAAFVKNLMGASDVVLVNEDGEDDTNSPGVELDRHPKCDDPAAECDSAANCRVDTIARHILAESSLYKTTIFTACQPDTGKGAAIAMEYAAAAASAGRIFVPVTLVCAEAENLRRLERQISHAMYPALRKHDKAQVLAVRSHGLFEFPEAAGNPPSSDGRDCVCPACHALHLDVTNLTIVETGFRILKHVQDVEDRQMLRQLAAELAQKQKPKQITVPASKETERLVAGLKTENERPKPEHSTSTATITEKRPALVGRRTGSDLSRPRPKSA